MTEQELCEEVNTGLSKALEQVSDAEIDVNARWRVGDIIQDIEGVLRIPDEFQEGTNAKIEILRN